MRGKLSLPLALIATASTLWGLMFTLTPELLPSALGGSTAAAPAAAPVARRHLPDPRSQEALGRSIAERLRLLGVRPGDVIQAESAELTTPAGPWAVETATLYLPPELAVNRVAGVLKAIPAPGVEALSWRFTQRDDLTYTLEASLDRVPSHALELIPWQLPASPRANLRPPEIALVVSGVGEGWGPTDRLLSLETPMTFAVQPFTPWALEWAEQARRAGKEVWVDWGGSRRHETAAVERVAAIPFARGVLSPPWLPLSQGAGAQLMEVAAVNGLGMVSEGRAAVAAAQRRGIRALRAIPLGGSAKRDLSRELIRLQNLAVRDGAAIGAIAPQPQDLGLLINWLIGLRQAGFVPATASDALLRMAEEG